jgi:hypothetical protein
MQINSRIKNLLEIKKKKKKKKVVAKIKSSTFLITSLTIIAEDALVTSL